MKAVFFNGLRVLITSYLTVFFFVFMTLMSLSIISLYEISKNAAVKSNEALSANIQNYIDHTLSNVEDQMLLAVNHKNIQKFYESVGASNDEFIAYQAITTLKELFNTPLISSAYLYRPADDKVLELHTFTTLEQFYDQQFIRSMQDYDQPFVWQHREGSTSGGGDNKFVTLAKYANLSTRGFLVVNIRTDSLLRMINTMVDPKSGFAQLYDQQGTLIVSTNSGTEDSLNNLLHTRSNYSGWTLYCGSINKYMIRSFSSILYIGFLPVIIAMLIAVLWMVYIKRRNYKPVADIVTLIQNQMPIHSRKKSEQIATTRKPDEFHMIRNRLEELYEFANLQFNENELIKNQGAFRDMVLGLKTASSKALSKKLKSMGAKGNCTGIVTTITELDRYPHLCRTFNQHDVGLYKYVVRESWQELIKSSSLVCWTELIEDHRLYSIFFLEAGQSISSVEEVCTLHLDWVNSHLPLTVTIATDEMLEDAMEIPLSFQRVSHVLQYKCSAGDNQLIRQQIIQTKPSGDLVRQMQMIETISESFRLGNSAWREPLQMFFETLKGTLFTKDDLQKVLYYLIYNLKKEMLCLPSSFFTIWSDYTEPKLNHVLNFYETINDIQHEFTNVLSHFGQELGKLRDSSANHAIVDQVRAYIEENYSDPNLSLAHLSEEFKLKPGYLSRLFKDQFGVNYVDFIAQMRLEHAKQLLQNTTLPIQDIADQIGYATSLTFIRAFKKYTGVTPGHYRKTTILSAR